MSKPCASLGTAPAEDLGADGAQAEKALAGLETGPDGADIGRDPRRLAPAELRALGHRAAPLLQAMRRRCVDCCGGKTDEVRRCTAVACPLWPYRMGDRSVAKRAGREARRRPKPRRRGRSNRLPARDQALRRCPPARQRPRPPPGSNHAAKRRRPERPCAAPACRCSTMPARRKQNLLGRQCGAALGHCGTQLVAIRRPRLRPRRDPGRPSSPEGCGGRSRPRRARWGECRPAD